ncbi:hypothetical protein Trydic_g841 [Trypoxylus dichotomus]
MILGKGGNIDEKTNIPMNYKRTVESLTEALLQPAKDLMNKKCSKHQTANAQEFHDSTLHAKLGTDKEIEAIKLHEVSSEEFFKSPSTVDGLQLQDENVHSIKDLLRSDRNLAIKMNLTHTTVHEISTNELRMKKIYVKMVPFGSKGTGGEYWILEYAPETKHQNQNWYTSTSPWSRKVEMNTLEIKNISA